MKLTMAMAMASMILLAAASATAAHAQKLDPAQSEIGFTFRQMGVPVEGRFKRFRADISLDPKHPEAGKASIALDIASAGFAAPELDDEAAKADWFDTARHPQALLQSTAVRALGPGRFEVAGKLTLKGTTRDVVVPVALTRSGAVTFATGTLPLKRLDYKVGDREWADLSMVANEIQVKFRLALIGMPPF